MSLHVIIKTGYTTVSTTYISGASSGIGKAVAVECARRHAIVILACRNRKKTENVIRQICDVTGKSDLHYVHLDLSVLNSVKKCAEEIRHKWKTVDVLVNNAGIYNKLYM